MNQPKSYRTNNSVACSGSTRYPDDCQSSVLMSAYADDMSGAVGSVASRLLASDSALRTMADDDDWWPSSSSANARMIGGKHTKWLASPSTVGARCMALSSLGHFGVFLKPVKYAPKRQLVIVVLVRLVAVEVRRVLFGAYGFVYHSKMASASLNSGCRATCNKTSRATNLYVQQNSTLPL